jgi:hypothetical protein
LPVFFAASTGLLEVSLVSGGAAVLLQAARVQQKAPNNRQAMIRRNMFPFLSKGVPIKMTTMLTHRVQYVVILAVDRAVFNKRLKFSKEEKF